MEHYKNAVEKTVDGRRLSFIRCDSRGNVLSDEELSAMNVINPTIKSIVSEVTARINADDEGLASFKTI